MRFPTRNTGVAVFLLALVNTAPAAEPVPTGHSKQMARSLALFKSEVRPILKNTCIECHGGKKIRAGLNMDTREGLLEGGENGPTVIPGDAANSRLISLIEHREEPYMPKGEDEKLDDRQIAAFAEWIDTGAAYDHPILDPDAAAAGDRPMIVTDDDREFWSFKPLGTPTPPRIDNPSWSENPIDQFIGANHQDKGLPPNPEADPRTLIRRIYFDLIGLPPTPAEVETFVRKYEAARARDGETAKRGTGETATAGKIAGSPAPRLADSAPRGSETDEVLSALIDRLLASPRFGEKWARHWLDVARFAESHGFEQDYDRPYAYHYRDFVIQAFNRDMPYDQFVRWQLAGDEFAPDDPLALMATGFLGAGVFPTQLTEKEFESARYDELDDMAATTGTAFLGLTIGCARCHDHKYDPIPVKDYYRLLSTFTTTIRSEIFVPASPEAARRDLDAWQKKHAGLEKSLEDHESGKGFVKEIQAWLASGAPAKALEKISKPNAIRAQTVAKVETGKSFEELSEGERAVLREWYGSTADPEWKKRQKAIQDDLAAKPPPGTAKVQVSSEGFPPTKHHADGRGFPHFYPETFFLKRGDVLQKQEAATQGFLQVLLRDGKTESYWQEPPPADGRTSYRRTALANWITDTGHGAGHLLARVIVNRLWHHHFGSGIVATPSDFGFQGMRPTNPDLLDYLAGELIRNGWRLKPIHKQIMLSAAYRRTSDSNPAMARIDPENRYLWRFTPRRLEAENIRDSLLALSGTLDTDMFGPGSLDAGNPRRSIYLMIKRSMLIPMMQVFDSPEPLVSQGSRPTTTIAPQALFFMNNPDVRRWIDAFARRLDTAAPDSFEEAIDTGYRMALGRPPTDTEFVESVTFLEDQVVDYKHAARTDARILALGDFCQILISLNEFAYID